MGFPDDYTLVPRRKTTKIEECEYACECGEMFWSDDTGIYVECPACGNDYDPDVDPQRVRFTGNKRLQKAESGKTMADGPRYKMIGNSWPVPVVRWIGERIEKAR